MLEKVPPGFGCELKGFPKSMNAHYIGPLRKKYVGEQGDIH